MTTHSDEEIDFLVANHKLEKAFTDAKSNRDSDPAAYRKAKEEFHAHRSYWRGIRSMFPTEPAPGDAVATPNPAKAVGTVQEVG